MAFNQRANSSQFTSQAQFNSERNALLSRLASLNTTRTDVDADIVKYDDLLAEYNSISIESKKLYNSIDSTLAPTPSL